MPVLNILQENKKISDIKFELKIIENINLEYFQRYY